VPELPFVVAFYSSHFETSRRFYEQDLGWPVASEWDRPDSTGFVVHAPGGGAVEVMLITPDRDRTPPGWLGLVIEHPAADLDAWHARLEDRGVTVAWPPRELPGGKRAFSIHDPDGVLITFMGAAEVVSPATP
jgi:catechol 2,3-dioxygenase-like lactoylglutathione lyase family enzyme